MEISDLEALRLELLAIAGPTCKVSVSFNIQSDDRRVIGACVHDGSMKCDADPSCSSAMVAHAFRCATTREVVDRIHVQLAARRCRCAGCQDALEFATGAPHPSMEVA